MSGATESDQRALYPGSTCSMVTVTHDGCSFAIRREACATSWPGYTLEPKAT